MKKLIHDNVDAVRQMARLEEDLWQAKAEAERVTKEKAEAERAAAEAAKKAAEESEAARAEAVANVVAAFIAEGWRAEGQNQWVASVVEASVDAWVKGPGAMWLARKGEDYYAGGGGIFHSSPHLQKAGLTLSSGSEGLRSCSIRPPPFSQISEFLSRPMLKGPILKTPC
ncbi:unnamed protein product [Cuscuta europaea]|uniref:Uncharacterized protein n=1 Tax=Cuscuta europaea TaxID=41803 RepID=A0A9P1E264_CUSEU|nr:unnamed protein product [Cuscuta europaea]